MALIEQYWPVNKTSWKKYEEIVPFTSYIICRKTLNHIRSTLSSKNIHNIHRVLCQALMRKEKSSREEWVQNVSEITDIKNITVCDIIVHMYLNRLILNGSITETCGKYTADPITFPKHFYTRKRARHVPLTALEHQTLSILIEKN